MPDDAIIKVENVSKTFRLPQEKSNSLKSLVLNFYHRKKGYERQLALDNVSFEVKKGEFFGIAGRNGSGKSTLLKLLAGIYAPTKGSIQVNGGLTPFIELGVGFNPELTGRENVFLNGALLGYSRREMKAMYKDIVDFAEIPRFMDQKLKNYSSGMQVRLAFSIAIRVRSDILLLDEVLAVGDAAFQQKCFDYFEELKEQKKTVVFVSHDMDAVRRFCNRAVYIHNGKLIRTGTPFEIADIYLEENMEAHQKTIQQDDPNASKKYALSAKLLNQDAGKLNIRFSYKSESKEAMYIGMSIIKDGIAIAGITTSQIKPIRHSGSVIYELDLNAFNGGMYDIGAGLFKLKNTELLCIVKNKLQFLVKGDDPTKDAALKLPDTWKYE